MSGEKVGIAIVGAGSHVFARRLIADVLTWPSLKDSTIALMDLHQGRLDLAVREADKLSRMIDEAGGIGHFLPGYDKIIKMGTSGYMESMEGLDSDLAAAAREVISRTAFCSSPAGLTRVRPTPRMSARRIRWRP